LPFVPLHAAGVVTMQPNARIRKYVLIETSAAALHTRTMQIFSAESRQWTSSNHFNLFVIARIPVLSEFAIGQTDEVKLVDRVRT
jgi:hypothetical protein